MQTEKHNSRSLKAHRVHISYSYLIRKTKVTQTKVFLIIKLAGTEGLKMIINARTKEERVAKPYSRNYPAKSLCHFWFTAASQSCPPRFAGKFVRNKTEVISLIFLRLRDTRQRIKIYLLPRLTYDRLDLLDSNYRNVYRPPRLLATLTKILQTDAAINSASAKI